MLTWMETKEKYIYKYPSCSHREIEKEKKKSYNCVSGLLSDRLQPGRTQRRDYVSERFLQLICTEL